MSNRMVQVLFNTDNLKNLIYITTDKSYTDKHSKAAGDNRQFPYTSFKTRLHDGWPSSRLPGPSTALVTRGKRLSSPDGMRYTADSLSWRGSAAILHFLPKTQSRTRAVNIRPREVKPQEKKSLRARCGE